MASSYTASGESKPKPRWWLDCSTSLVHEIILDKSRDGLPSRGCFHRVTSPAVCCCLLDTAGNIQTLLASFLASKVRVSKSSVTNLVCYQHFHFARFEIGNTHIIVDTCASSLALDIRFEVYVESSICLLVQLSQNAVRPQAQAVIQPSRSKPTLGGR